ncbi:hypothetical protein [Saliphagus sp. LR7]|uniref:hypothetical protein n=1 Tax=Saliphagus sp. LR7 TaxID=2282654 RepID=UPI000DF81143|nr:hypothetical protein [Saliphagus sp. LR7]
MAEPVSLDGRTLVGVENDAAGDVGPDTVFEFEQDGNRLSATYSGGSVVEGHLLGTIEEDRWDVRYVQVTADGETATGHSVGVVSRLEDGRVRVEDEWEWESKSGSGTSVHEEIEA